MREDLKSIRARIPFTKQLEKTLQHFEKWIIGKGSCRHSHKVPVSLLKKAFVLEKQIRSFNGEYQKWIRANERFKPEYYLLD